MKVENLAIGGVVVLGVVGIIGLIVGHRVSDVSGRTRELAQREADAFVRDMGIKARVRCADKDTDGDGYVSCPLVYDDGRLEPLECAGSFTINTGCRPPKAVVRQ